MEITFSDYVTIVENIRAQVEQEYDEKLETTKQEIQESHQQEIAKLQATLYEKERIIILQANQIKSLKATIDSLR